MENVVWITGDNCAANVAIAKKMQNEYQSYSYIGRDSHRFNLIVVELISPSKETTDKVNAVMKETADSTSGTQASKTNHS